MNFGIAVVSCITIAIFISCTLLFSCSPSASEPVNNTPIITSISPISGNVTDLDTIKGLNFNSNASLDSVFFNGVSAKIISATENQLIVTVPQSATGNVSVKVNGAIANGPVYTYNIFRALRIGGLNFPYKIAVDTAGTVLYISDQLSPSFNMYGVGNIIKFNMLDSTAVGIGNNSFSNPIGVAVDNNGNSYVGDYDHGRVAKITSGGSVSTWSSYPETTYGLTINLNNNNIYVLTGGKIAKINNLGISTYFLTNGLNNPNGIAVDNNDNVYVADRGNKVIYKINSAGNLNTFASGFNNPTDVAVDINGNVYVADWDNLTSRIGKVVKLNSNGAVIGTKTGFNLIWGIAVDRKGYLYVTDSDNRRIIKTNQ